MTSIPLPSSVIPQAARPGPAASGHGAAPAGAAIDPIRLLNKYKYLFAGVAVFGAVVGTGAHFILRKVYPLWTPAAVFHCLPATQGAGDLVGTNPSAEEMSRFMQTQVRILTSTQVLSRVAEDPTLRTQAPKWAKEYEIVDRSTGAPGFDSAEALKDLKDDVKARVLPGTNLVELSMSWNDRYDTKAIIGMVRQRYMQLVADQGRVGLDDKLSALRNSIKSLEDEANGLSLEKERLIQQGQVDAIDDRVAAHRAEQAEVNRTLIDVQRTLDAGGTKLKQMEAELNHPGGVTYGDELKEVVEKNPQIVELRTMLQRYETDLKTLLQNGVNRDHRQFKQIENQIASARQQLEEKRQELLKETFNAELDSTRKTVAQFESQNATLIQKRSDTSKKLQDLARIQSRYNDLDARLQGITQSRTKLADALSNLAAQSMTESVNRVVLLETERVPDELSFPQLKLMIPAGVALFLFLTAGIVLLVEIVDQRVKSPSDITLIPRARLVGWVPDAAEDPAGAGAVETAFRDRPRGIVAESFRQVRSAIAKRVQQADHKTILVVSGMPSSGATSVAANLALSFAAADKKVLLIDANFRRPGLHRVFAVPESPGLADVLSKQRELSQAVQATNTPNLDLLTAGAKDQRVYERLATEVMGETLAKVRSMYDLVLIDVAPAVVGGDAMALAQRCDASVLVVRAMADKRGMVARIKNELSETRGEFLGAIVNGVKSATGGYMKRNIKTAHEYHND
ncbi:tyrosine-protein kinase Etk/Wzc [Phycisphaerales bacterium]|nr:tyrosine-protein kinase Etk/Wzc [Phycisphaerales bacterium]